MTSSQRHTEIYGPAAFRGHNIPDLPSSDRDYRGVLNAPLKWGHYAYLDAYTEVKIQLQDCDHIHSQKLKNKKTPPSIYCNEKTWNFEKTSIFPKILFLLNFISFPLSYLFFSAIFAELTGEFIFTIIVIGFILMLLSWFLGLTAGKERYGKILVLLGAIITVPMFLWLEGSIFQFTELSILLWISLFLTFMAVIGCDLLAWCYSRFYQHDGSGFNRRTGMVTIARRFRKPFIAPFYEFDPVMQLMVTPHGSKDYGLWLHHRYSSQKVGLAGIWHSFGLDKQNIYALWDTLQRYMDVEQPLPDLPVLEQSRHLDPTTVEADKRHKRPPRRWRDLDVKAWLRSRDEREQRTRVMGYPWQQQPCTLRARFDPKLDVETYYQQQREMGIYATPKPEDYDNIHRPKLKIFQDKNRAGN